MTRRDRLTPDEIENIRNRAGMTCHEFAQTFDVSPTTVYNWEGGKSTPDQYRTAAIRKLQQRLEEKEKEGSKDQFIQTILGIGLAFGVAKLLEELFSS